MQRSDWVFPLLVAATGATLLFMLPYVFLKVPTAQLAAGGAAQKIFYFHVPAAYAMYLCGVVCLVGSAAYLLKGTDRADAWARAGAECAVVFGLMMITSGPLWARKAWGAYWSWDPRLTTTLLSVLIYVAIVMLRAFAGDGSAERRFAAALGVLGTVNLPIIHYSVRKWGGNHPIVVTKGGGGLRNADMRTALMVGFLAMTFIAIILLWQRARVIHAHSRLERVKHEALASGIIDEL